MQQEEEIRTKVNINKKKKLTEYQQEGEIR